MKNKKRNKNAVDCKLLGGNSNERL